MRTAISSLTSKKQWVGAYASYQVFQNWQKFMLLKVFIKYQTKFASENSTIEEIFSGAKIVFYNPWETQDNKLKVHVHDHWDTITFFLKNNT